MGDWADEIALQKERLFLWVPVAFGAGIAAYFGLGFEPALWVGAAGAAVFLPLAAWLHRHHHENLRWFAAWVVASALFLAAAGFFAAQAGTGINGTPVLAKSIGPVTVAGRIESIEPLGGKKGNRVVLDHVSIEKLSPEETPRKVRLTFKKEERVLAAGMTISTLAKLDAPSAAVLPGGYDFRRHLFFQGIGGVGFSFTPATIIDSEPKGGVALFFENLRTKIGREVDERAGPVTSGIMTALITGERGAIAEEDDEAMKASGLYHLLSISGTHVCMVAGVLFFFVRLLLALSPWAALHWPIKKIAAVAALLGAAFYVILAGADVPAQRSLLMTGLVMVAVILDRSPFSLRLIAFSALVVLAIAPHSLVGVSFQMSYAAVAALICFFDYIRPWWMGWYARAGFLKKTFMYVAGILMTSVIAGTITGFFSLYHFQSYAVYGVLANMIAVPLTGFVIMPAAIVAVMLMPFGAGGWALDIMEWGTMWMLGIAHWTGSIEGAVVHVTQWPVCTYAFLIAGIVLFLLWRGWRGKGVAVFLVATGLFLTMFAKLPDIMVAASGKLVAVRTDDNDLYFSSGRKDKFTAENWLRLMGREGEKPKTFKAKDAPLLCDDDGCRWEAGGKKISIIRTKKAFIEDCRWANLMIAEIPLQKWDCQSGAKMLDLYDALDGGAQSIYVRGGDIRVRNVREDVGMRPWAGARRYNPLKNN